MFNRHSLIGFFLMGLCVQGLMAHDLSVEIDSKINSKLNQYELKALDNALGEVSDLLPQKMKKGLPQNIKIKFEKLSNVEEMPIDVCTAKVATVKDPESDLPGEMRVVDNSHYTYAIYHHFTNTLKLDKALLKELVKGRSASVKLTCQHKSLYDQVIATIIHELTHAFDLNNGNPSSLSNFYERTGFKRGLLRFKNKNVTPMRTADPYEIRNSMEAYAVNMEYFAMDPEYACRKPALFQYYKKNFEIDPFPARDCKLNRFVMMSTTSGYYPIELKPERIYRVDYLMASPGKELSSGFGHSMFRLVLCAPEHMDLVTNKLISATPFGPKCLKDEAFHLVVSYRANVEGATLNYIKGLFGGYPSMLFILNFGDVLNEYNRDELRDVVAYPLTFSTQEKEDFINKVSEEHWNYQGSYKFITNNCAVESYDLLKAAFDKTELDKYSSVTPKGVLEDLEKIKLLSLEKGENLFYPAQKDILIKSLMLAYEYKSKGTKKDSEFLKDFIIKSSVQKRERTFDDYSQKKKSSDDMHTQLSFLKERNIVLASFSIIEQQVLRKKALDFRKKIADFLSDKDKTVMKFVEQTKASLDEQKFISLASKGYGVPLLSEMKSAQALGVELELTRTNAVNLDKVLKEYFPEITTELDHIGKNIKKFNLESNATRKEFRQKLEVYILQVINNLSLDDQGRGVLAEALQTQEGMNKFRALLDVNLVTSKEIVDAKLRKMIQGSLN